MVIEKRKQKVSEITEEEIRQEYGGKPGRQKAREFLKKLDLNRIGQEEERVCPSCGGVQLVASEIICDKCGHD